ncbi:MAG TPA: hypothetical protein DCM05_06295 [Elusimicrobia bacterium]|nr:hypothetical protein [Elusimicrobiota bacterium]
MKLMTRLLAALLSIALGAQPTIAQVQSVRVQAPVQSGIAPVVVPGAALQISNLSAPNLSLSIAPSVLPTLKTQAVVSAPSVKAAALITAASPISAKLSPLTAAPAAAAKEQAAQTPKTFLEKRVHPVVEAVAEAGKNLPQAQEGGAREIADRQFSALTGEKVRQTASAEAVPVAETALGASRLESSQAAAPDAEAPAEPKAPITHAPSGSPESLQGPAKGARLTQVFKDPERNRSFWKYVTAYSTYLMGFQMYIVGMPYFVSSFTKNLLNEAGDPRINDAEALKALIRQNRSLQRLMHWGSQAVSYFTVPLFSKAKAEGPGRWLVISAFARAGILALIPGVFFASGLLTLSSAFMVYFGLVMAQSFFQGIFVTMDSASTTRIMGDKSVTAAERMKANSILTFISSLAAIIGPALAGRVAAIQELFGKTGVGGPIIYGIYAGTMALAGLIFAGISIIKNKVAPSETEAAAQPAKPLKLKDTLKTLVVSLKDGVKLVFKNRFLRTLLIMALVSSLFSDPLIFNILPEFVEGVLKAHPATIGAILDVPVIGWVLKGITSTPMGYYGLLTAAASMGSIVTTLLVDPLRKLLKKLGFKTEESLTIPFYLLSALEVPLFWMMISFPSIWGILGLYALQSIVTGFGGIIVAGLYQKELGKYSQEEVPKILSARSFLGILTAILATYLYGFVLQGIPTQMALTIAGVAMTILGILRVAAPWLFFSKEQRKGETKA